jgi:N-glycosidase YbiA
MKLAATLLSLLIFSATTQPATTQSSTTKIAEFQNEYRFLSNFWPAEVVYEDITYPTAEHAYQATKTLDMNERKKIAALKTPAEAKHAGEALKQRPDWPDIKFKVMEEVVRYKFTHHADLAQKLLNTGDAELEEGNTWNDRIWGVSPPNSSQGENHLGIILMKVRDELKSAAH